MNQEKYHVDILSNNFSDRLWMDAVDSLIKNREEEIETIRTRLEDIQSNNCFDIIDELGW